MFIKHLISFSAEIVVHVFLMLIQNVVFARVIARYEIMIKEFQMKFYYNSAWFYIYIYGYIACVPDYFGYFYYPQKNCGKWCVFLAVW